MAKVHKSVGNGRGEIKADSISPRLYTVKSQPMSFPDFSRRFFASLTEKVYTFSLALLARFTLSLIPYCSA